MFFPSHTGKVVWLCQINVSKTIFLFYVSERYENAVNTYVDTGLVLHSFNYR